MRMCAACGGLIGEPGRTYSYAGRWCYCTKPLPSDYPHVQGFPEIKEGVMPPPSRIEDLVKSQPAPTPMAQRITPTEFVHWLKGYFAAGGPNTHTKADAQRIAEELDRVHT